MSAMSPRRDIKKRKRRRSIPGENIRLVIKVRLLFTVKTNGSTRHSPAARSRPAFKIRQLNLLRLAVGAVVLKTSPGRKLHTTLSTDGYNLFQLVPCTNTLTLFLLFIQDVHI
ncbi:unnamed protein product [Nesidiocoris tenuis]|uniref:Uncharacterized protein n=1 Tax=Nesidiocoris tenuis TaxID=355587 RepID=A0A6H5HH87_9HEMI|nr:unnamed protein product [Nesidiocoris tenuis]